MVASGNISQGAALNVTGLASLTASSGSIVLPTLSTYGGGIAFNASSDVQFNVNSAVAIRGSTNGNLSLQAAGNVTQSGVLTVANTATISAAGADVILTNSGNNFGGLLATANNLTLVDIGNLNLGGAIYGAANVTIGGNLGNGTLGSFNASSLQINTNVSSVVSLNANVAGQTNFTGPGSYSDITYTNASAGSYNNLIASGTVAINQTGTLNLPSIVQAASVQLSASGAITQAGFIDSPNVSFAAAGHNVTLDAANNNFINVSGAGADITLRSTQNIDPNLNASGTVSFIGTGINQSAGNAINSVAFSANVTGGLGLFGNNNLGSITATAGADMDIRNGAAPLELGNLMASKVGGASISLNAAGAVSQVAGSALQADQVSLTGGSLGASTSPIDVQTPRVRFNATAGDAYIRNNQTSELVGMQAAGTASYFAAADVQVVGDVSAANVQINSNNALDIGSPSNAVQIFASSSIDLQGADITIEGGTSAGASAKVFSQGTIRVNTAGNFVIQGGTQDGAFAELFALRAVTVTSANTLVQGGSGNNAYAKLDPALGSLLTINSGAVDVQGGSGAGAYGAIVSDGDIVINAASLNLAAGTGLDADAVVISQFGLITAPSSCNGCVELSTTPLGDRITGLGLYSGGRILAQSNNTNLLSTQLLQIGLVVDDLSNQSDDDEERGQPDIVVEGQVCP